MHFRLLRKLGVCFQLKFYEYHYHCLNPLAILDYKLTLLGFILLATSKCTPR